MRRILLALTAMAAVTFVAGRAQAQTPTAEGTTVDDATGNGDETATFIASASIADVMEFDVIDNVVECGTITPDYDANTGTCEAGAAATDGSAGAAGVDAQIEVRANAPWYLTLEDFNNATSYNSVELLQRDGLTPGSITLALSASTGDSLLVAGTTYTDGWEYPTGTDGTVVNFAPGAVSDVQRTDESGDYVGYFTVTLAQQ